MKQDKNCATTSTSRRRLSGVEGKAAPTRADRFPGRRRLISRDLINGGESFQSTPTGFPAGDDAG